MTFGAWKSKNKLLRKERPDRGAVFCVFWGKLLTSLALKVIFFINISKQQINHQIEMNKSLIIQLLFSWHRCLETINSRKNFKFYVCIEFIWHINWEWKEINNCCPWFMYMHAYISNDFYVHSIHIITMQCPIKTVTRYGVGIIASSLLTERWVGLIKIITKPLNDKNPSHVHFLSNNCVINNLSFKYCSYFYGRTIVVLFYMNECDRMIKTNECWYWQTDDEWEREGRRRWNHFYHEK